MVTLDKGRFRPSGLATLAIIFLIIASSFLYNTGTLSSSSSTSGEPRLPVQAPPPLNVTKVSITPSAITANKVGDYITFGVNISRTAALSAFWVTLKYDNTILNATGVDWSTGVFGQLNPSPILDCVVGGLLPGPCPNQNEFHGPDKVNLWLWVLGRNITNTSGLLFNVNFQVIGTGLANIHVVQAVLEVGIGISIPTVTFDSYFSNKICGSAICRPLIVNLNYTRIPVPVVGRVVKFNATIVNPNNDAIQWYHWEWGDSPNVGNTSLLTRVNYANHTYLAPDNSYRVTLIVNDTFGITGIATIPLAVGKVWVQLGIGSLGADPRSQVIPGTRVNVTVQMQNLSTTNQSAQVSVLVNRGILGNQTLLTKTCSLLRPSGSCSSSTVLDTSNLTARVYELTANAQLTVTNSTLFQNDTSASSRIIFLWLVTALPNAGLSIAQGSLIGIGGIVVAYAAFLLVRRITRRNTEF